MPRNPNKRPCAAKTRAGKPCVSWALRGSDPPLCPSHLQVARERAERPHAAAGARMRLQQFEDAINGSRCTALKRNGARCGRWALRGESLCAAHAERARQHLPPGRRCAAAKKDGARCSNAAMHGSKAVFGRPLCNAHAPRGSFNPGINRLPPPSRRCRGRTLSGGRCRSHAMRGANLCYYHAFPNRHKNITHGYYRRLPHFPQPLRDQLQALARGDEPLAAETALLRLKMADLNAYLARPSLPVDERERVTRLLFACARAVAHLSHSRRALGDAADLHEVPGRKTGGVHSLVDALTNSPLSGAEREQD